MALSLIHDRGYAHGDLHLGNLFLQLPSSLDNLSPIGGRTAILILSDFGVAFRSGDKSWFKSYTPLVLRPPESLFEPETPLTFASDIWSLGCVIFELLAHRSLISGYFLETQDEMTAAQVYLQGPMPPAWWRKWEKPSVFYDEEGNPLSPPCDLWSWERRFREWVQSPRQRWGTGTLAEDELDEVMKLLQRMLAWKPSERLDIYSVLESEWMTRFKRARYTSGSRPHPLCESVARHPENINLFNPVGEDGEDGEDGEYDAHIHLVRTITYVGNPPALLEKIERSSREILPGILIMNEKGEDCETMNEYWGRGRLSTTTHPFLAKEV
ncbi:hypothetical protein E4U10_006671 [Claviceps purpurea]|nr:hypothetical protein E4U10_006671 [Claviceps purpurea]